MIMLLGDDPQIIGTGNTLTQVNADIARYVSLYTGMTDAQVIAAVAKLVAQVANGIHVIAGTGSAVQVSQLVGIQSAMQSAYDAYTAASKVISANADSAAVSSLKDSMTSLASAYSSLMAADADAAQKMSTTQQATAAATAQALSIGDLDNALVPAATKANYIQMAYAGQLPTATTTIIKAKYAQDGSLNPGGASTVVPSIHLTLTSGDFTAVHSPLTPSAPAAAGKSQTGLLIGLAAGAAALFFAFKH
jgi:hypothetical protein